MIDRRREIGRRRRREGGVRERSVSDEDVMMRVEGGEGRREGRIVVEIGREGEGASGGRGKWWKWRKAGRGGEGKRGRRVEGGG